jgi:hypothetical protein
LDEEELGCGFLATSRRTISGKKCIKVSKALLFQQVLRGFLRLVRRPEIGSSLNQLIMSSVSKFQTTHVHFAASEGASSRPFSLGKVSGINF